MAVLFSQLNTIELLEGSSNVLLKELGIKGGQIVKLRIAIQKYKNQVNYNCKGPVINYKGGGGGWYFCA